MATYMTIIIIAAYILIVGWFILTFLTCTSISDSQRRKLYRWYAVLMVAWFGVIYYLQHFDKDPSYWVDEYMSHTMGFGWALPAIIAQAFNRHRFAATVIRLERTVLGIAIAIIFIIFMIWTCFVYAPSYYENKSWSSLISVIVCAILVTIAFPIMYVQKTVFYGDGISYRGFLWAWSDFEAYSWKDHKLVLQRRKSRPFRIAIPAADWRIVDDLLAKHIVTDAAGT
jgi:hypothetical protein